MDVGRVLLRLIVFPVVLVLSAAACSTGRGASPAPGEERTVASLPEDPCELLTAKEMAVATRLQVSRARRVPDIGEIIRAERESRAARTNTICSYETPTDFVAITIIVPPLSERSSAAYWKARETYFGQFRAQPIAGLGEDAWLAAATTLHVLAGKHTHFMVATRMYQPGSREVVIAVARAVLARLYR